MFNVLLDSFPDDFDGYKIDTDFRVGIQISQLMQDDEFSNFEKFMKCRELLFDNQYPDIETVQDAIIWLLNGWYTDKQIDDEEDEEQTRVMDFDIDQWRIYSAFLTQYGINLNKSDMHYWTFRGLLSTLEECAFTRVVDVRTRKIEPKMSPEEKKMLKKVKKQYALEEVGENWTAEERECYENFMKYAKAK